MNNNETSEKVIALKLSQQERLFVTQQTGVDKVATAIKSIIRRMMRNVECA